MARRTMVELLRISVVTALVVASALLAGLLPQTDCGQGLRARSLELPGTGWVNVTVVDNAGRRVAGAAVVFNGSVVGTTGADGTLTIHNVPPNGTGKPYFVWANKTGYADSAVKECVVVAGNATEVELTLLGSTILGTVTGPSGGIVGATVSIFELGITVTVGDPDGSYRIDGLQAGPRSLTANASGYVPQVRNVIVPLASSMLVNFVLSSEYGSVSGHVYHSKLLTPLTNASVSIQVGPLTMTVATDKAGSYNLTGIPEGTYAVTASKEGFYPSTAPGVVVTKGNRTSGVDFFLEEKPTRLFGVVRSGTLLLVGVNVSVEGTAYFSLSGADGSYEIRNITAGNYTVRAALVGYETAIVPGVVVPPGGEVQLNINLAALPGAILRGTVVAADTGEQLSNVFVSIIGLQPEPRSTTTNIKGEFEFTGLTAGNYTLRFEKSGYRPMEISHIIVSEDAVTNMTFEMTPLRKGFEGFIFGFDMAHSMMILALFLTIVILAIAIYLRIRTFQSPESAPAVYDQEEGAEGEKEPGPRDGKMG